MRDYIPDLTERYPEGFGGIDTLEPRDLEYEAWDDFTRCFEEEEKRIRENPFRFEAGQKHTIDAQVLSDKEHFTFDDCLLKFIVSEISEDRTKVLLGGKLINRSKNTEHNFKPKWFGIEKDCNGEELALIVNFPKRYASHDTLRN